MAFFVGGGGWNAKVQAEMGCHFLGCNSLSPDHMRQE